MATDKVLAKAPRIAAHLLEASRSDRCASRTASFRARRAARSASARSRWPRTSGTSRFPARSRASRPWRASSRPAPPSRSASHFCQVEVDRETGAARAPALRRRSTTWATIMNPLLADGQRLGGIVQGLGQALCEEVRYDESGQLLTATLMDYAMPTRAHVPAHRARLDLHADAPEPARREGHRRARHDRLDAVPRLGRARRAAARSASRTSTCRSTPNASGARSGRPRRAMIPAEFDYVAPRSLEEARRAASPRAPGAKLLGGGMSLIPAMKHRLAAAAAARRHRSHPGPRGRRGEAAARCASARAPRTARCSRAEPARGRCRSSPRRPR